MLGTEKLFTKGCLAWDPSSGGQFFRSFREQYHELTALRTNFLACVVLTKMTETFLTNTLRQNGDRQCLALTGGIYMQDTGHSLQVKCSLYTVHI